MADHHLRVAERMDEALFGRVHRSIVRERAEENMGYEPHRQDRVFRGGEWLSVPRPPPVRSEQRTMALRVQKPAVTVAAPKPPPVVIDDEGPAWVESPAPPARKPAPPPTVEVTPPPPTQVVQSPPKPKEAAPSAPARKQRAGRGATMEEIFRRTATLIAPAPKLVVPASPAPPKPSWTDYDYMPPEVREAQRLRDELLRRIAALDNAVVARLHRSGCAARNTWPTASRMRELVAGHDYARFMGKVECFVACCERAMGRSRARKAS